MYLVLLTIFREDSFNTEVPVASNLKNTNTLDKFRFANISNMLVYIHVPVSIFINRYTCTCMMGTFTLIK